MKTNEIMGLFDKFGTKSKQSSKKLYPEELEQLIDIAIEDGNITDNKRAVLHKKAAKFDIDPDELDMVLESRLGNSGVTTVNYNTDVKCNTEQVGKGPKKCPACGAPLTDPNMVHCPYCGMKVINIARDILEALNSVVPPKKVQQNTGFFGKILDYIESDEVKDKLREQKENIIMAYNVPMAKETILEFLAFSVQKGCKDPDYYFWTDELGEAWYKKSEQVIAEARRTFGQDVDFMAILKDYAVKFGMEKKGLFRR